MSDWPIVTLEKAGVILIDCDHKTPKAQEGGLPYVGIPQLKEGRITLDGARLISEDDFHHWRRKAKPTPNDVILSRRCNPGETAYVPEGMEIALGQNLVLLRSDGKNLYPPLLRWVVRGPRWWDQIGKFLNVGAVFNSLKCADIPNFEIMLPPMQSQIEIAKILGCLDKKIELNRQINQTLEQIAQAIFKSWFVDFDPVKAKIAAKQNGEDPTRAAMRAISGLTDEQLDQLEPERYQQLEDTATLFPDEMEKSELGEIPKGWKIGTLDDLCLLNKASWTKKNAPDALWYVDLANTKNGVIEEVHYYCWDEAPSRARRIVKGGDTIVGTVRPGNRSYALVGDTERQLTASTGFAVLTPKMEDYTAIIYLSATSESNIERLAHLADGGAYPAVRPEVIMQTRVVIATEDVIKNFHRVTKELFTYRNVNLLQIKTLSEYRDTLLPKLLSGEISVNPTA